MESKIEKAARLCRALARQEQRKNCVPAPQHIQDAVRAKVAQLGRIGAGIEIGLSKETVLSVVAGLELRPGSQAILREWYTREQAAAKPSLPSSEG